MIDWLIQTIGSVVLICVVCFAFNFCVYLVVVVGGKLLGLSGGSYGEEDYSPGLGKHRNIL